jgi:oligopeptide transport system substrate-binding protein
MRHAHLGLIAVALIAGLGCGSRPGATEDGKVLRIGNRSEVQDLDPHLVTGVAEHRLLSALFEGLTNVDLKTGQAVPGVAASWEVSPDGLEYVFRLRPEAKWSNGDPLTAADFVYAWRRMLAPGLGSEYAYMLHCLKNGKAFNEGSLADASALGVEAVDAHTLRVTLEAPTPYFLTMQVHFAWYPVHQATIERFGAMDQRGSAWTRPGNHVSNGPFLLEDWRPEQVLTARRNPHYWGAAGVGLDGVAFYPISDEQTEERMFRSGQLDVTYSVPMYRIEEYRKQGDGALQIHPYLGTHFHRFNTTRPPFNDARVRRAFALAIDREALAANVLKAGEAPAFHLVPPDTAGYTTAHRVREDLAEAKALLAEAGYPGGAGLPELTLIYNSSETEKLIAQALQQVWRERLGARVGLVNQDYKVYLNTMNQLDYDIARSIWIGDVMDPVNFLECFLSGGGNNRTGWASPEYDALIAAAYAEPDATRRFGHLQAAERLLLEEAVIAPIFFMTQKYLQSPRVTGLTPNPLGLLGWAQIGLTEAAAP